MKTKSKALLIAGLLIVGLLIGGAVIWDYYSTEDLHKPTIARNTSFPEHFVGESGVLTVEIPEVYELLNVVISLSEDARSGKIAVNKQTPYHQQVQQWFGEYAGHPAVKAIQQAVRDRGVTGLRVLFAYQFDGARITHNGTHNEYGVKHTGDKYADLLADFAEKSSFREFYRKHREYYRQEIESAQRLMPVRDMWDWLEANFPKRHHAYRVVLSPLLRGTHNTFNYYDRSRDYSEVVMFIALPGVFRREYTHPDTYKAVVSRMLLTEIDHNYVNPATNEDRYLRKVARCFSNLEEWNSRGGYRSPALTFNEYMTWSTACLYVYDTHSEEVYEEFLEYTYAIMEYRGFIRFEEFHEKMLFLYIQREPDEGVYDLYPEILRWCKQ